MIVKCDKCQTRFKIPDEKVTEKGVKVRCTKCQTTFKVARAPEAVPQIAPVPAPAVDADPFAKFGLGGAAPDPAESTRPGIFPEGIAATREQQQQQRPLEPLFSAQQDVPREVFDQPTRIAPIPAGLREPVTSSAAPVTPPPPISFDPSNPFGEPATAAASAASALPQVAPPVAPAIPSPLDDPFAGGPASTASHTSASLMGDFPPPDDLFGKPHTTLTSQPISSASIPDPFANASDSGEPDRGLFDMPEPPPPQPSMADGDDDMPTATMPRAAPAADAGLMTPVAKLNLEKPAGRPEDVGMDEGAKVGAVRRTVGLVVNLALASALVLGLVSVGTIYLNEGKLDPGALSLEPVKALFSAPRDLLTVDVSNGLYDTRSGKQVFYVRGEVENRGGKNVRAQVQVEVLDGTNAIMNARVLAGRSATPEELYAVTSAEELEALSRKLDAEALELKPGTRTPFLIAFYEYPPQLADYRLKVSVTEAPPGETAAR